LSILFFFPSLKKEPKKSRLIFISLKMLRQSSRLRIATAPLGNAPLPAAAD